MERSPRSQICMRITFHAFDKTQSTSTTHFKDAPISLKSDLDTKFSQECVCIFMLRPVDGSKASDTNALYIHDWAMGLTLYANAKFWHLLLPSFAAIWLARWFFLQCCNFRSSLRPVVWFCSDILREYLIQNELNVLYNNISFLTGA